MIPYIISPRWARLVQRSLFATRYLLLAAAGGVAVFQPEPSIEVIGWVLITGAWVSLFGVASGRFHFELVPIWFLIAALTWAAGILFSTDRYTSGVLVIALVPALAERLLHLSLVASRARDIPAAGEMPHGAE